MVRSEQVVHVAEKLAASTRVAVLTGAGISAESGLATFRDPDGLWQKFKPQELANIDAFLANPELVQLWYQSRRMAATEASPNSAHFALVELESQSESFTLVTQNVDGLHERAGSKDIVELHGNILRNYCIDCGEQAQLDFEATDLACCTACGGLIRPDVVWFGEQLPQLAIRRAYDVAAEAEVFISIGTSAEVHPAADLPLAARRAGAFVVEININETVLTPYVDVLLSGRAGDVVPKIVEQLIEVRA